VRRTGSVWPAGRREPQLKLGRAGPRTSAGLGAAIASTAFGPGTVRVKFGSSSMGRSLLGGSVFSHSPASALNRPAVFGRPAPLGLSSPRRHRGNPAGGGLAGRPPRFSRGGGSLARLSAMLRRAGSPSLKSPGRRWLRGVSSRNGSLRGTTLGGASMSRRAFGRSLTGRSSTSRSLAGRSFTGRGLTRRGLSSSRTPRLRMPRPRTGRRWRTGGYR
jgi:hypothetical protein